MTVIWPPQLPLKIRYGTGWEYGSASSKAVTEFEGGNKLRRQTVTNAPVYMTLDLKFNDAQYELFLGWYVNNLGNGTRNFIAPVIVGTEVQQRRCAFDMDSLKPIAEDYNRWSIPVIFEINDVVLLSEASVWYYGIYGVDFGIDLADALQQIVNVDFPTIFDGWE
jgi:hypothetical protein